MKTVKFLRSGELDRKFPIYAQTMKLKFEQGFMRNFIQRQVCNFFHHNEENQLPKLPATCVSQIFSCLTNKDLINLKRVYCAQNV